MYLENHAKILELEFLLPLAGKYSETMKCEPNLINLINPIDDVHMDINKVISHKNDKNLNFPILK